MERLLPATDLPFEVGALYNRRQEIHGILGGQQQGGISTPADKPFVIIFTGEAGKSHGYADFWNEEDGVFNYFGEGQSGDMKMTGGNRAIGGHVNEGKRLLVFKSLGHGQPCRFDGEFICLGSYVRPDTPATRGPNRNAIVFRLQPLSGDSFKQASKAADQSAIELALGSTTALRFSAVRTKQDLFRRRLNDIEKKCRLTSIMDLRFLRASHIKPWASCDTGNERTDGNNGLLLTPHADLLFDKGWVTFGEKGRLRIASDLPQGVRSKIGLNLREGRNCGHFNSEQQVYLEYHRNKIFEKRYRQDSDPLEDLVQNLAT
jgi:hypothetical protein